MLRPSITSRLGRQRNSENSSWHSRSCHDSAVPYGTGPRTTRYPALRAGLLSGRPYGTLGYKQLHSLGAGKDAPRNEWVWVPSCHDSVPGKAAKNVETPAIYANRRRSRSVFAGREEDLGSRGSSLEGDGGFAERSVANAGTSCIERCLRPAANQEIRSIQKSS
jgi:hypothetical protein